jgi:multisubunit Na+/H+ antiporter MnhE subunit
MDDPIHRLVLGIVTAVIVVLAVRTGTGFAGERRSFKESHPLIFWAFVVLACMLSVGLTSVALIELLQ